ncbi:hypothetical protein [Thermococcus sibiricus]|uniref:Uncharacterized protein n=2 Tax=Thermococcus sibiricus TaxID=172049 RepID=C6A3S3_THESM|nr:hypothetical protein [Thermococcus sibiricus]ACS90268.1 hypothetical protein TSIB_1214 [Thermococcus sibiricus MM 739]KUK17123.1 MAG: Uncharacterized protein XD54_1592 [Thermococcus sibiricus]
MEEYQKKLLESGIEGFIIMILAYFFYYQNYLLYKWHCGLPLPSKTPFLIAGILTGTAYILYKAYKIYPEIQKHKIANVLREEKLEEI